MSSFFAFLRQDLRASLVASLLVLGHALLLTAVKAPQESRTDELTSALGTVSALISITILWVTFTVLEALDSSPFNRWGIRRSSCEARAVANQQDRVDEERGREGEGEEDGDGDGDEDAVLVFCMTSVELVLGLVLLSAWTFHIPKAQIIMNAFIAGRSAGLTLIRTSYMVGMISIALLQLHLIASIGWQGIRHGGVYDRAFWTGRTGWWLGMGKIRLTTADQSADVEKV